VSWWRRFGRRERADSREVIRRKLETFRDLVERNNRVLELIAGGEEKLGGEYVFDQQYLLTLARGLEESVRATVVDLNVITDGRYRDLERAFERARAAVQAVLEGRLVAPEGEHVIPLEELDERRAELAGEKLSRLAGLARRLSCPVPPGFVISTQACQRFLRRAKVDREVEWIGDVTDSQELDRRCAALRRKLTEAAVPGDIARAIRRSAARLSRGGAPWLAVRSSALGEDGQESFAGQYRTLLGVPADGVPAAWREVVASLYAPEVVRYRMARGLHPTRGLMAVGVMAMVPARAAGVAYSLDPARPDREVMLVSAAWGLGRTVVEGVGGTDRFEVSREPPHRVIAATTGHKERMYTLTPEGVQLVDVLPDRLDRPCLDGSALQQIAALVLRIERHARRAQDIEWAFDEEGRLLLLQARPLAFSVPEAQPPPAEPPDHHAVLMRDTGAIACRGIGAGRVYIVDDPTPENAPERSDQEDWVLVARTSTPRLSALVAGAAAVITDVGTPTGHLATIAREHRVPTIVDAGEATQILAGETEVTVDAEENVVYRGTVRELLRHQLLQRATVEEAREYRVLKGILRRVAPLNLKDPSTPTFSPAGCTTYHDIIRFAHEKAVAHFAEGFRFRPSASSHVRRLDLEIPLDLVLVDVGGGIAPRGSGTAVGIDELRSAPLLALLDGLTAEGVWATEPADMDLDGFMSSATRSGALTGTQVEQNVAIISEDYLNLSLRLGYHFNIVDCYLGQGRDDNYIYFRFVGGVTEMTRRSRRVELLRRVLEAHAFAVESAGDLIYSRIKKIPPEVMDAHLRMIGRLIGYTRQLDVLLRGDELVERYAKAFLDQEDGQPPPDRGGHT